MLQIAVVSDENAEEALYVDGALVRTDDRNVSAREIAEAAKLQPMVLSFIDVDWSGVTWPKTLPELIFRHNAR